MPLPPDAVLLPGASLTVWKEFGEELTLDESRAPLKATDEWLSEEEVAREVGRGLPLLYVEATAFRSPVWDIAGDDGRAAWSSRLRPGYVATEGDGFWGEGWAARIWASAIERVIVFQDFC